MANVADDISSALFTLDTQSVRITSIKAPNGQAFLKVEGPHSKRACYDARDDHDLIDMRAQLEEALVAQGFARRHATAERRERERRRAARSGDRRQPWQSNVAVRPCPPEWTLDPAADR